MSKFIIYGIFGYVIYRFIKSVIDSGSTEKDVAEKEAVPINNVMIQDPYCKKYFPQKNGICLKIDGEAFYFCSTACKDRFLEGIDRPDGGAVT